MAATKKEQAGAVAEEAVTQVRDLLDQTWAQVSEQAGGAQHKLAESVRSLSEELRLMGKGSGSGSGPAPEFARTLASKGSAVADYLAAKEPGELVEELRTLAGRRPGGFLLGALAAGVAAGRLMRTGSAGPADRDVKTPTSPAMAPAPATPYYAGAEELTSKSEFGTAPPSVPPPSTSSGYLAPPPSSVPHPWPSPPAPGSGAGL